MTARSTVTTAVRNARRQTVIIEYHDNEAGGPEWWVMLPSGQIQVVDTASAALREVKAAARRGNRGITVTTIQWRGTPAGWTPPSA